MNFQAKGRGAISTVRVESAPGKPYPSRTKLWHRRWSGCESSRAILFHALVFIAAFLLIFSRRPDAILNPQFFAEDGQRWFADAYHFGLRSLLIPDEAGGYLHTAPRLAALLSLLFPFRWAPLAMNLCAITIQILPVNIFLSSRFSKIGLSLRLAASLLYLALPNSYEIDANATTIQWHLALLACLVLLAQPAANWNWRFFDAIVLMLTSIESPMGVLLVPVAGAMWWVRRNKQAATLLVLLLPGATAQTAVLLLSRARRLAPLGASLERLNSIVARQVFLGSLLGKKAVLHFLLRHSANVATVVETIATVVGILTLVYVLRRAPAELKIFVLFAFAVLAMGLTHPMPGMSNQPAWELMRFPGTGNRYYFLPSLAFLASLYWIVFGAGSRKARWLAGAVLLLLPIGIIEDWRYPAFKDLHFREYAARFEAAPSGTMMTIPINPVGAANWKMELTKR